MKRRYMPTFKTPPKLRYAPQEYLNELRSLEQKYGHPRLRYASQEYLEGLSALFGKSSEDETIMEEP